MAIETDAFEVIIARMVEHQYLIIKRFSDISVLTKKRVFSYQIVLIDV